MRRVRVRLGRTMRGNPDWIPGVSQSCGIYSPMVPGNKLASRANLTPSAHKRRMEALYRGWETTARMKRGEKVTTFVEKKKKRLRKRIRLRETLIKEAREIQDLARMRATEAMDRLAQIIASPASKDSDAIQAAVVTLDRAYGKASQTHINANINGKTTELTQDELTTRAEAALKRIRELTGGTPKAAKGKDESADIRKLDRDPDSPTQH